MIELLLLILLGAIGVIVLVAISWYRIVPADFADVVISGGKMRVYSTHEDYRTNTTKASYFKVPSWFFFANKGMRVHRIPLTIIPINVPDFLAFDMDRARFVCEIVAYVTVAKPIEAAKRFSGELDDLKEQISKVVQATMRDATTKKKIREIINDRQGLTKEIRDPLVDVLTHWGLDLRDIELIDFKDPDPKKYDGVESHVISDISSIIEAQINSEMRQKNAEQMKQARLKEAEADENSRKRELERDEMVGRRQQERDTAIALRQKEAREKQLEVEKVNQVKTAEIMREKAVVEANQRKEVEAVNKTQKQLEGEGDRLRSQEQAKGNAAAILENILAEAKGKEELQKALNKFGDDAIRAMVAQQIVEKERAIGTELARSIGTADTKVFLGSDANGFDVGKTLTAIQVANTDASNAVLNKIARPNDLGFTSPASTSPISRGLTAAGAKALAKETATLAKERAEEVVEETTLMPKKHKRNEAE